MCKDVIVTKGVKCVKGHAQKVIMMIMKIRELKLFLLLLGFLGGNLFGTILNSLRSFFVWDGLIIILLITIGEIISYLSYKPYLKSKARNFFVPFYIPPSRGNFFVAFATLKLEASFFEKASYSGLPLWSRTRNFFYPLWFALRGKYLFRRKSFKTDSKKQPLFSSKGWGNAEQRKGFLFNFFKIGAMIGFFVDAFKVGS